METTLWCTRGMVTTRHWVKSVRIWRLGARGVGDRRVSGRDDTGGPGEPTTTNRQRTPPARAADYK
jgi:hypothetical protein